ncbi:MAG TPA: toll/interleukin-1 receptor domain-containing protein, partial [Thermoanaerobaculia bacterium]
MKWSGLLEAIEFHRVVPIVGPELCVLELDGVRTTLYDAVARELIQELEWNDEPPARGSSLESVVRHYLRDPDNQPRSLYYTVHKIVNKKAWPTPEPLRQLASIFHFEVFVTISFDTLLEQAINEVRFGGVDKTLTRVYSISRPLSEDDDLPLAYKAEYKEGDHVPVSPAVYHLFGKAGPVENDYTLREEDLLNFCQRLQSSDRRPPNLFDLLNGRDLLLLGSGFPGWLTRFFLAIAKQGQMFSGFPRPLKSGILADRVSPADEDLVLFLERNEAILYPDDSVQFVAELHRRWNERFPEGVRPALSADAVAPAPDTTEVRENKIFISYAREDQKYAEAISNALTAKNLKVWLDRSVLKTGSEFKPEIVQAIRECSVFVPILSRSAFAGDRRFLFREWHEALDSAKEWMPGSRFIQPVIVDDMKAEDLSLFPAFRDVDIAWLENGQVPDRFVSNMID